MAGRSQLEVDCEHVQIELEQLQRQGSCSTTPTLAACEQKGSEMSVMAFVEAICCRGSFERSGKRKASR